MQPMFCKFPKQIIDIYLKIWICQCSNPTVTSKPRPEPAKTQLLMKIMETIMVNNFPTNIVIHAFLQSTAIDELYHYYSTKGSDKKGNVLDYPIDKSESRLLYFLYVYFNYIYLNQKELTYEPLLQIWFLIMKVLKPLQNSRPLCQLFGLQRYQIFVLKNILLSKFIVFNYELYSSSNILLLADSLLRTACKVQKSRMIFGDRIGIVASQEQQLCIESVLKTIREFKSSYRSLNIIFKCTDSSIIVKIEEYLKNC